LAEGQKQQKGGIMSPNQIVMDPLLSPDMVQQLTTLSTTEIHRRRKAGTFPEPEPIGDRRVAYRQSVIAAWLSNPMGWRKAAG
jgi:prophage regulatory protein